MSTPFSKIYDRFFGKITDDMYFIWSKEDTERDAENILIDAIPGFEFPRFPLYDYGLGYAEDEISELDGDGKPLIPRRNNGTIIDLDNDSSTLVMQYNCDLTEEEINILAILMYNTWLQRQIASIENIRMKYSGSKNQAHLFRNKYDKTQ